MFQVPNLPSPSQLRVLEAIKLEGEGDVSRLATSLAMTESGVRQQIATLVSVEATADRRGRPGRDRLVYSVSLKGEALFPDLAAQDLASLVQYIRDRAPGLVEEWLEGRIADAVTSDQAGAPDDLPGRLAHVARRARARGMYVLPLETDETGAAFRVAHCPMLALARAFPLTCEYERRALERSLPGFELELVETRISGAPHCLFRAAASPA
ncbi:MAG: hypothetical protein IT302_08360 [Dehalococcoidia bacterium]|nr:hypothetical protein [Dehalococcoidia bacterium]